MADAPEQIPPPNNRVKQDVIRLQFLPPLEYEWMNEEQRLAFIQWYQQTPESKQLFKLYPQDSLEGIFAAYPTQEPVETLLKQSFEESFKLYVQQKWSCKGKSPPQPDSYFLFHKNFSRLAEKDVMLTSKMDLVPALVFSQQEVDQMKTRAGRIFTTAIGSEGNLLFHEFGKLSCRKSRKAGWLILLREEGISFLCATKEFVEEKAIEVWFRRAKNGVPQFIFCPVNSEQLPLLPPPLSTPGKPEAVLALSRLDAMPALLLERFKVENKNDFYEWLLRRDKFHIRDEDPESLKLAPLLFHLCSNDFQITNSKLPIDEVTSLYEDYVQERWRMPSKQSPEPQSVYLFEKRFCKKDKLCIWLAPQELMQQAESLVLNTAEVDQLGTSNSLPVTVSIGSTFFKFESEGLLENEGTNCRISNLDGKYKDIFSYLSSGENFEIWFLRTQYRPKFIIKPRSQQVMR